MRVPRQGRRGREQDSTGSSDAQREAIRAARAEADAVVQRQRSEKRARQGEHWQVRLRGAALETKRRLKPAGRGIRAFLGRVAPPISSGLLTAVRLPVAGVAKLLDGITGAVGWVRPRVLSLASAFGALVVRWVTPVNTVAFVALVAAVSLGASQFLDYRGVAVGADLYEGRVGTVAPAPLTDVETAGAAHLYLLVPVAVAAIVLTVMIVLGRPQLSRYLLGLGLLTIVVSLAIDLPTGLDTGTSGGAYASSDVELLEGFWIQLFTGATLSLCGFLLGRYAAEGQTPPGSPAGGNPRRRPRWLPSRKREQPDGPGGGSPWKAST